ncbi:MAG: YqaE/Pmp3 family membrane protein [Candidatus Electrothrix sp. GW3-4]|uniref:YqaE/Pmp3 family membrane protein n=1 Tax=Candidatus Electrothrix sp. GW3-4 TaxID=3126740 RepID=UPI0030D03F43
MKERTADFLRIILSLIIPPVGVFFQEGFGMHFWINIILTLLGYIPGVLHAVWIILKK